MRVWGWSDERRVAGFNKLTLYSFVSIYWKARSCSAFETPLKEGQCWSLVKSVTCFLLGFAAVRCVTVLPSSMRLFLRSRREFFIVNARFVWDANCLAEHFTSVSGPSVMLCLR